jgi:serpin B
VLTNAIYFKGDWATPFAKSRTKPEDFHLTSTQTVKAPLMHLSDSFHYFDGGTFQVLDLPYHGWDLSMMVVLPRDINGLPALEQGLTAEKIQQWISGLHYEHEVIVTLPRFKMTGQFELSGALGALGMRQAFQPDAADFSGMNGRRDLSISAAIHKAYIDVDEEGTEAAAATGIIMQDTAMRYKNPPIVFRADHPFLFLIRDDKTGGILFMGRVEDPAK